MKLTKRAKQMLLSIHEGRNYGSILESGGHIKRSSAMGGATRRMYKSLQDGGYIEAGYGLNHGLTEVGRAVAKDFQWMFWTKEPFNQHIKCSYGGHPTHGLTAIARQHPDRPEVLLIQLDKSPCEIDGERWDIGWHEIPRWWARKRIDEL